jgi:hypothetical protein
VKHHATVWTTLAHLSKPMLCILSNMLERVNGREAHDASSTPWIYGLADRQNLVQ